MYVYIFWDPDFTMQCCGTGKMCCALRANSLPLCIIFNAYITLNTLILLPEMDGVINFPGESSGGEGGSGAGGHTPHGIGGGSSVRFSILYIYKYLNLIYSAGPQQDCS